MAEKEKMLVNPRALELDFVTSLSCPGPLLPLLAHCFHYGGWNGLWCVCVTFPSWKLQLNQGRNSKRVCSPVFFLLCTHRTLTYSQK